MAMEREEALARLETVTVRLEGLAATMTTRLNAAEQDIRDVVTWQNRHDAAHGSLAEKTENRLTKLESGQKTRDLVGTLVAILSTAMGVIFGGAKPPVGNP